MTLDLSSYEPAPGGSGDANQITNAFIAIQNEVNALKNANIDPAAAIAISKLASYPADATKVLRGDGSWYTPTFLPINATGGAAPAFTAGWSNSGAGLRASGYMKTAEGIVLLIIEANAPGAPGTITTLPAGYRPSAALHWVGRGDNGAGTAAVFGRILADGSVIADSVPGGVGPTIGLTFTFPTL